MNIGLASQKLLQITKRQHIFPKSGLKRFLGPHGKLQVLDLRSRKVSLHGLDAGPFIVQRGWDQRSEAGLMSLIERQFGIIAARVMRQKPSPLDSDAHTAISSMFSLWRIRHHRATNLLPDVAWPGLRLERQVSKEMMDQGEHVGIITAAPDGRIPGRMMAGPLLQLALDRQTEQMAGKRWGLIRAREGEFVLPDTFGDIMIMPLSPTYCFIAEEDDLVVDFSTVAKLNSAAEANATGYLAARNLSACPGLTYYPSSQHVP